MLWYLENALLPFTLGSPELMPVFQVIHDSFYHVSQRYFFHLE